MNAIKEGEEGKARRGGMRKGVRRERIEDNVGKQKIQNKQNQNELTEITG